MIFINLFTFYFRFIRKKPWFRSWKKRKKNRKKIIQDNRTQQKQRINPNTLFAIYHTTDDQRERKIDEKTYNQQQHKRRIRRRKQEPKYVICVYRWINELKEHTNCCIQCTCYAFEPFCSMTRILLLFSHIDSV